MPALASPLASLLHTTFGHTAFRANQEAVCRAATEGQDVLLVMPTGAGKSLCYQLPALARGGTGLVISPLIALMDDQAAKLSAAGLRVARVHSGLSRDHSRQACRDYLDGLLDFLFIAPERLRVPGFPEMLARRKPALIAIDEAHCISAWGHDFRPDYRTLGDFLPALRPAPIIALTATATPTVQRDIVTQLSLHQPALFIHGFRRDNLHIEVLELSKPRRTEFTINFLADPARRPAIVYAPSRKSAEELAADLNRTLNRALRKQPGVSSTSHTRVHAYHAGLDPATRERVQTDFQSGKLEVVVATIAFGMGIDKADVRTVIHFAMPASVEAYYQEIGRAGRDGQPSKTVLLYSYQDRKMHDFFLERDYPVAIDLTRVARLLSDDFQMPDILRQKLKMDADTFAKSVEKLASQGAAITDLAGNVRRGASTSWQSGYEQQVHFRRTQIDRMMDFAQTQQCRMTALIRHFGDTADVHRPCGHCDFCAPSATSAQTFAEPSAQQDRDLRLLLRTLATSSRSTGKLFTDLALPSCKERRDLDNLLDGLARAGLLTLATETFTNPEGKVIPYKKAALTHEGQTFPPGDPLNVLLRAECAHSPASTKKKSRRGQSSVRTRVPQSAQPHRDEWDPTASTQSVSRRSAEPWAPTPAQQPLESALRAFRTREAAKTGKPAFIVFSDAALRALVEAQPRTLPELLAVSGFGPDKSDRYGAALTAICRGEAAPALTPAPIQVRDFDALPASALRIKPDTRKRTPSPRAEFTPPEEPTALAHLQASTEAPATSSPPVDLNSLTPDQQALEFRLRAWRKSESERLGLPQFFVLGTSTLRSIVVSRPRTLTQLQQISGIDPEKSGKFGHAILAVCNTDPTLAASASS